MDMKNFVLSLLEYGFCFMLYMVFAIAIHEWIHLYFLKSFGGDGYIVSTLFGAQTIFTKDPLRNLQFIAFSGGLGVFSLYSGLFYWNWKAKSYSEAASLTPMIFNQLFYGIFEGLFEFSMPFAQYLYWGTMITVVGQTIGLIISLLIFIKYQIYDYI